ncbi:uncharacterized protein TrAtP1_007039 [Trichoderma atroviride]|uniref:uncharacterized protein n=1 Tax=Hypocrea atroviridis TaxID=63577 RepID=UPI003317D18F|nr:hypothetical protein TrAtP1_007039 [Trichoderma atroviride]
MTIQRLVPAPKLWSWVIGASSRLIKSSLACTWMELPPQLFQPQARWQLHCVQCASHSRITWGQSRRLWRLRQEKAAVKVVSRGCASPPPQTASPT